MANPARRLAGNVTGPFFVDDTCIDCDTCRKIAPDVFTDFEDQSVVHHQPRTETELLKASMSILACPTGSIGTQRPVDLKKAMDAFPEKITDNVYFCGYTSEDSFGAWSYLIKRDGGNILIDSPRFTGPLVKRIEAMGGIAVMFLTHKDDVADHERWARHFKARRVLHQDDVTESTRGVELRIEGQEQVSLDQDLHVIPTPGHTKGHSVLLYKGTYLFTGDHLCWSEEREALHAFRTACWYDWNEQIHSMRRLMEVPFEWILPGHGRRCHLPRELMGESMQRLVEWMDRER